MDNKDLLANLYDKVYELLTAAPGGGAKVFEPSNIRVQMTQNEVLNLEDYADAISGSNPEGDLFAAEAISNFVDKIPDFGSTLWAPKENLARTYKNIVSGANEDPDYMPTKKQDDTYKKLQKLLVQQVTVKEMKRQLNLDTAKFEDVPTGKTTTTVSDTPLYTAYKEAKAAYESALLDAKDVVLNADLTTNEGKRRASVDKKRADLEVEAKYNDWVARGKSDIDQVLDALEAIKNDSISAAIADAKSVMDDAKWISSGSENGQDWILSSVTPSNWTEPTIKGTTLTISSDNLKTSTSKTASTYSEKSKGWFWYGSSSSSGETQTKKVDLKAESFKLSGELVLVRIQRSWLNQQLFTMKGWTNNGYPDAGDISDGEGKGALPGIPVAFLMMRNVSIEAKFNQSDSDYIHTENKSNSRSGWGWGPFGGSSRSSTSESTTDNFESTGDGVKITFDQPQVVAWISTLVPKCPPEK
jgi:hypothetical protein